MKNNETIIIDPVAMNIVNRIAPGTRFRGTLECEGGLLVQGRIEGDVVVKGGPLVLMPEGVISGETACDQDSYLFGRIEPKEDGLLSEVNSIGAVFMADTLNAKANITAGAFKTYEGAEVEGHIKTVKRTR